MEASPNRNLLRLPPLAVHLRWMIRRDMPEVHDIEQDSFEHPWSLPEFSEVLRRRNCIAMVAESAERVAGYFVYELYASRVHVLNFAVGREFRRRGVGVAMVQKLETKLYNHSHRERLTLEIRETNLAGQLFFQACGFKATAVLDDFYDDTAEAAYFMQLRRLVPVGA